jgi:DNA-binding GntR family transcriptional regulator
MKTVSAVDLARKVLKDSIISGELKPGQQLKEEALSSRLEISRPPIREALKTLEAEGLITRRPRRGVFVSEITENDIWEIYTLKMVLYELATSLACEKFTNKDIARLEAIVHKMGECIPNPAKNRLRYQRLNEEFHALINEVAGHQRLTRISSMLHNQVKPVSYKTLGNRDHMVESYNYHRDILEAIKNRDKDQAARLTREHVAAGLNFFNTRQPAC